MIHRLSEHSLAVIAQDDPVIRSQILESGEQPLDRLPSQLQVALHIGADHLLVGGYDPGLQGGWSILAVNDTSRREISFGKHPFQVLSRLIMTHHTDHHHFRAKGADIAGHIGRATQFHGLALQTNHRHRCLGADTIDASPEEAVNHDIAHHRHPLVAEASQDIHRFHTHSLSRSLTD